MLGLANIIYWLQLHVSNTGSLNFQALEHTSLDNIYSEG